MEGPLPPADAKNLHDSWHTSYNIQVQPWLMGGDTIVNRTYREWKNRVPTTPDLGKVRSQVHSVQEKKEERTALSATHFLGFISEPDTPIHNVVDYYFTLRCLTNTWAYVGNWDHTEKIKFMDQTTAMNYADDTLKWTMDSGVPNAEKVEWYRVRDIATRTKMMELMRQPPHLPAHAALAQALDFMRNEWRPARVVDHPARGRGRSRSHSRANRNGQRQGKGGGKANSDREKEGDTSNTLRGGGVLCGAYNKDRCKTEQRCPKRQIHLCNHRVNGGRPCGKAHIRCKNN